MTHSLVTIIDELCGGPLVSLGLFLSLSLSRSLSFPLLPPSLPPSIFHLFLVFTYLFTNKIFIDLALK